MDGPDRVTELGSGGAAARAELMAQPSLVPRHQPWLVISDMSRDGDGCGDDEIHSADKCANYTSQKKAELREPAGLGKGTGMGPMCLGGRLNGLPWAAVLDERFESA